MRSFAKCFHRAGLLLAFVFSSSSYGQAGQTQAPGSSEPLRLRSLEDLHALRHIDRRIELVKQELAAYRREIDRLGPASPFRYSTAFVSRLDFSRLAVSELEAELEDLEYDRRILQQGENIGRR